MPVVKGLPERPKEKGFKTLEYLRALESYVDALENWIDIECFNTGADEAEEKKLSVKEAKNAITDLLEVVYRIDEKTLKEWIVHKYPHGAGLYE